MRKYGLKVQNILNYGLHKMHKNILKYNDSLHEMNVVLIKCVKNTFKYGLHKVY